MPDQKSVLIAFPYTRDQDKGLIRRIDLESLNVKDFFIAGYPYRLALGPNGQLIVGHEDGFISLHNSSTLEMLKDKLQVGYHHRIAITPTGMHAVVGSKYGQISVINLQELDKNKFRTLK